ncbi:MAG: aspartate carbamoyltransferase regulatory subunit [Planctomycetota bacterium]|nr:MAG: aspartate carbamoyltransferase regulatory subunit [Planctomycetota bacterium]
MSKSNKKELSVTAIKDGTVIDHIPADKTLAVVKILSKPDDLMTIGVNLPSKTLVKKGFVKISDRFLTEKETSQIALISPTAKVNIIKNYDIISKTNVSLPKIIKEIISCNNPVCITNVEKIHSHFHLLSETPLKIRCHYCERTMGLADIQL